MQITHSTQIEKGFKILYSDMEKNEICIECLTDRGEISLWRLIFSSQKNTEKWLEKLKKAVRPEWEDPNTGFCSICAKPFKLFRRQHHCRKCGKVICANHSKMIENLSELGYEQKVRICVTCVNRIGNINGVQRARSLGEKEKERNSTLMYNSIVGFNGTSSVLGFNK